MAADFEQVKQNIADTIYENGEELITGQVMQDRLLEMVSVTEEAINDVTIDPTVNVTVNNTTGTPSGNASFQNNQFSFEFSGIKGETGNSGYTGAAGELEVVNNLNSDDATAALSAYQGKVLDGKITQLGQELYGKKDVILQNVTTAPGTVYITNEMVSPGDVLLFELESINNLTGVLRAEKTGYVFDTNIYVDGGQTATVEYTVPSDFLRIYTQTTANPMKIVSCKIADSGDIQEINEDITNLTSRVASAEGNITSLQSTKLNKTDVLQNVGTGTDKAMSQNAITGELGEILVLHKDTSGWTSYEDFDTVANVGFVIRNLSSGTISFVTIADADSVQKQEISVSITAGSEAVVTPSVAGQKIRIFMAGTGDVNIYGGSSIRGKIAALDSTKLNKSDVTQATGTATDKAMSQDAVTKYGNSPFAVDVPDALRGIVAFRMNNVTGNGMPVDNYMQFRVSAVYRGGAWHLYMQMQKTTDGITWSNYDAIEILAADAPSPLPTIEEVKSKYGAFTTIINWPLMGNISQGTASYILKKDSPNYFVRKLQEQIKEINLWPTWGDYENKDRTRAIVKVDANGNGDYTTIAAAYAAITDSSYDKQYEVVIYPGTYNEYNLIPPKFTHTHGLIPGTVIVTSEGVSSTLPVFDQKVPCKLSNMTIISGTGYCVHQDQTTLQGIALVNENLHCKKVYGQDVRNFGFRSITNPAILGIGSHVFGSKFIWKNCVFEDGQVASHTVGGSDTIPANQHLIYRNCKLVNAYIHLLVAGASSKVGNFVCEIDGLYTEKGRPSVVCQLGARSTGDSTYNFPWQIIGGGNKNFVAVTLNSSDTLTNDVWPNINTGDVTLVQLASGVSVSKGQFVDIAGNICTGSTDPEDVVGIALEDGVSGGTVRVCVGSFAYDNAFNSEAFPVTTHDGNYGIGSDGRLLLNASTIIGRVKYNNFYRI